MKTASILAKEVIESIIGGGNGIKAWSKVILVSKINEIVARLWWN
jgi:hypothetical protein